MPGMDKYSVMYFGQKEEVQAFAVLQADYALTLINTPLIRRLYLFVSDKP